MKGLEAKNSKQLDICLRMLYSEKVRFIVEVRETNKQKIVYWIGAIVDEQKFKALKEKYRILIS